MSSQTHQSPDQQVAPPAPAGPAPQGPASTESDPQDTMGNAALQEQLAVGERGQELLGTATVHSGSKHARFQRADGPVDNDGNAMWISTLPLVRAHADVPPTGGAILVQDDFEVNYSYWASSTAQWDDIAAFPGGAYDPAFNTRDGALKHEEAELDEAEYAFEQYEMDVKEVVDGQTYPTVAVAEGVYRNTETTAAAEYNQACLDLRSHANDAGPQAEWAYYQSQAGGGGEGGAEGGAP